MTWYDTNYHYKKKITIDHTKVSNSDQSSFPMLISFTDADLKTVGNGGFVQNASGFDIIFTNSAEDTKLDHEIEKYVASTGETDMWARIPTLSHTADTVIYMYFDNTTISSSQENATGVWDSNYAAVYHMKETAGTSNSIKDSTSNANHATPYTTYNTTIGDISTTSGFIGNAQSFNGTSHAIQAPSSTSLNISGQNTLTISAWVKRTASNSIGTIVHHGTGGVGGYCMGVGNQNGTVNQIKMTKYGVTDIFAGSFPADTNFHYLVEVGDSTNTRAYIDGSQSGTDGNTSNWQSTTVSLDIGRGDTTDLGADQLFNGTIDEIRLSKIARTVDWILTEYNNQNSPSTFYTVGSKISGTTTNTRTIPSTAAFLQTNTRTISSTAALLQTNTRTIPDTAALLQTNTRTIPDTSALLQTNTRTISSDSALLQTNTRTIPSTAALIGTQKRTISCTAALSGVAILPPTNITLYARSGNATLYSRSGDITLYDR